MGMAQVILEMQQIQKEHENEIQLLTTQIETIEKEKNEMIKQIEALSKENQEMKLQIENDQVLKEELYKLRIFKETIISGLAEKPVVRDGFLIFKKAQQELNREDYLQIVQYTKDFNAKLMSKENLLQHLKSICSHSLYLEFIEMLQ